jgi:probable HAF family extracellular repeat protein
MKSRKLLLIFLFVVSYFSVSSSVHGQAASASNERQIRRYKVEDLGTFGGLASYVNPAWELGGPHQMNRSGTIVGSSSTSMADSLGCIFCNGLDGQVPNVFHAFISRGGLARDLGALPGEATTSVAISITDADTVVGNSENGTIDPIIGVPEVRAVFWEDGRIKDLGTFGGNHSLASSINNRGQIVGYALNTTLDPFSWLGLFLGSSNSTQTRAFLWENGHKRDLGTLGGPDAAAGRINERGDVAGISYTSSIANPSTGVPTLHPFLWREGKMIDLGNLGGTQSGVAEMNNRGQVIGASTLPGDQVVDPFVWDNGRLIDLHTDTVGGNLYTANAINDLGQVVGAGAFPDHPYDAYVWENGTAKDLGHLDGDCYSEAFVINPAGEIAGQSYTCDSTTARPFLWQHGWMVDINELISDNSDSKFTQAFVINDHGEVGGIGTPVACNFDEHCGHALVLVASAAGRNELESEPTGEDAAAVASTNVPPSSKVTLTATEDSVGRDLAARLQARFGRTRIFGLPPLK